MDTNNKILIFIPMYNCENQIIRVLEKFKDIKDASNLFDIIIIDNGSKDNSITFALKILKTLDINIIILKNNENYGLGGSHKVAFNYALDKGYEYVMVLHGDDQGDIRDLVPYIRNGTHCKYDSFLGARFHPNSKLINYSRFRIIGNHIFNALVSLVLRKKILDLGSGLNIYKCSYLKDKFYIYFNNNLTFNVYMLFYGVFMKSKFEFFPLSWREEDQVSNAKLFSQSSEILKIMFKYILNRKSLFTKENTVYSKIPYGFTIITEDNISIK